MGSHWTEPAVLHRHTSSSSSPHQLPSSRSPLDIAMISEQGSNAATSRSATARVSLFDIHFIHAKICSHLSRRDIRRCTLVSRGFHAAFLPYLWRDISIIWRSTLRKFRQAEHQAALTRYASYVHSITTVYIEAWPLLYMVDETVGRNCNGTSDSTANGSSSQKPQMRIFPNLRVIRSLILPRRHWNVDINCRKMSQLLPLLDPSLVPKLESIKIAHLDFRQKAVVFECMARIRQLTSIKDVWIGPRKWFITCQQLRRIVECVPHVESFSLDVHVYHTWKSTQTSQQELLAWMQGESDESLCMEADGHPIENGPLDSSSTSTAVPTTTTTTTTLATTTAMTPSHSATVWRPLLILPDRFAMKHLELPISNCHSELDSIVAFLKRCPDIERFTVPPVLLTIQTVVKLTELLVDWIHLKELIIVEFYLTDNGLAEVIRTACQGRRRRLNGWSSSFHQFQHLDAFNTKSLENAISDLSFATISEDDSMMGQGLESLRISQGFRSMPETSRAIIELHAATLVSVTLVNSRVVNRADLQLLLCSCPSLESLVALSDPSTMSGTSAWKIHDPFLSTGDMLRIAGPLPMTEVSLRKQRQEENGEFSAQTEKMEEWGWVCTRLRVLKLGFLPRQDDWSCETGFPYELAVQLGRMRYLEDLRLDRVQGITFGLHSFQDSFGTPSSVSTSMSMLGSPPTPTTTTTITPTTWSETETMTIAPISIFDTMDQPCELGHYDIGADEEARLRTESVTMALRILAKELRHLRRLELKGLKDYVDRDEIRKARRSWEHIEWIQYSRSSI